MKFFLVYRKNAIANALERFWIFFTNNLHSVLMNVFILRLIDSMTDTHKEITTPKL